MDAELKEKWVQALRSDNYEQGHATLRNRDNTYCCLGVLCDIFDGGEWEEQEFGSLVFMYKDQGETLMPPNSILVAAALKKDDAEELADMNDSGATFMKIADWIEENL